MNTFESRQVFAEALREKFGKPTVAKHEISARVKRLEDDLLFLSMAALSGNADAFAEFLSVTTHCTAELINLQLSEFETAKALARQRVAWPILTYLHPDKRKREVWRLKQLELGASTAYRTPGKKPWSENTPANQIVTTELQVMHLLRSSPNPSEMAGELYQLPALTPQTAKQWFKVVWQRILDRNNGRPENDTRLRKLGVHKAGGAAVDKETRQAIKRSDSSLIRDGIHASLWSAFKTIVRVERSDAKK